MFSCFNNTELNQTIHIIDMVTQFQLLVLLVISCYYWGSHIYPAISGGSVLQIPHQINEDVRKKIC